MRSKLDSEQNDGDEQRNFQNKARHKVGIESRDYRICSYDTPLTPTVDAQSD